MNPIKPYTHNLFATHDSLSDALAYAKDIAAGCGTQSAYVMTAVMCVLNTAAREVDVQQAKSMHAMRCALADLQGSQQAVEQGDPYAHDWKAHALSIEDLRAVLGDEE